MRVILASLGYRAMVNRFSRRLLPCSIFFVIGCGSSEAQESHPQVEHEGQREADTETEPTSEQPQNEESPVGEAPTNAPLDCLVLHDIQGLHGGEAMYMRGDGSVVVQRVTPGQPHGLTDRRFSSGANAELAERVSEVISESAPWEMSIEQRLGIPDEARARFLMRYADGTTVTRGKWDGVAHEDFSRMWGRLMAMAQEQLPEAPTEEVEFDWDWIPAGVSCPALSGADAVLNPRE